MADDLLVIRFSPFSPERLLLNARMTYEDDRSHGHEPRWGVSVFAASPQGGETVDDMVVRVCRSAPVGGKTIATVLASTLVGSGFAVLVDEPPSHHHLVMLQNGTQDADVVRLEALLCSERRRNPAWVARP